MNEVDRTHGSNYRSEVTALAETVTGANRFKRVRGHDRRLDRLDDVKRKLDWRMDAADFRQRMTVSNVLATKGKHTYICIYLYMRGRD